MSAPTPYTQEYLDRGTERIGLHVYPEPDRASAPVVIVWPAMGTPARYYRPLAQALGAAGVAVVVVDLRGTGSSTPVPSRRSGYGYADIAGDVGAVLHFLKPRLDGRPVHLLGHSLGGQACAIHLAMTQDSTVDSLILVAVGLPWYRSYRGSRKRGVLVMTQSITAVSAVLGVWPGWGFGGRQSRGVIRDWGYTARHGRFPVLAGVDVNAGLGAVRTPMLAISLEHDRYTPAATLDQLCGKLTAAPVQRVHLSPEDEALDHFTWVRTPAAVVERVEAWLRQRGGAGTGTLLP
jgi:predicted alpha/beta hydrolase